MICFPSNIHQYNIADSVVHVQLCFQLFLIYSLLLNFFLPARVASNLYNITLFLASGWFMRIENNITLTIPSIMIKKVVITFEAEFLKYLRTFNLST